MQCNIDMVIGYYNIIWKAYKEAINYLEMSWKASQRR